MGKFWRDFRHDLRVFALSWRIQFRAAAQLRSAFVLQVAGMILNNTGLLVAWLFLFHRFGSINGWSGPDLIGVQGVNMIIFGVIMLFCGGFPELARYVDQGAFDTFLTRPASVLSQVASSHIELAVMGDVIMGLGLVLWYMLHIHASVLMVVLFLITLLAGMLMFWCFTLAPYLLAFYILDSDKIARNIHMLSLDTGIYPSGVLSGPLRIILLTAFPGLLIGVVPLDVLRGVHPEYVAVAMGVSLVWFGVTMRLFRNSLKRYESANLVGAR